jgi:hypothetical protein
MVEMRLYRARSFGASWVVRDNAADSSSFKAPLSVFVSADRIRPSAQESCMSHSQIDRAIRDLRREVLYTSGVD